MQRVISSKYSDLILLGNCLLAVKGLFRSDEITDQIKRIDVIDYDIDDPHKAFKMALVGGMAGKWPGAVASTLLLGRPNVYLDCMIHLKNGDSLEVQTTRMDMIKFILKWFHVKY